jgi:hypothetical protein
MDSIGIPTGIHRDSCDNRIRYSQVYSINIRAIYLCISCAYIWQLLRFKNPEKSKNLPRNRKTPKKSRIRRDSIGIPTCIYGNVCGNRGRGSTDISHEYPWYIYVFPVSRYRYFSSRAAGINNTSHGISHTTTGLVGTNTVRKVVVKGPQLVRAIITHPSTARPRTDGELDAVIHRLNANLCIILMESRGSYGERKGSEEFRKHGCKWKSHGWAL